MFYFIFKIGSLTEKNKILVIDEREYEPEPGHP